MDEDRFFLKDSNVTIVGLGLMGGSLALTLNGHCRHLNALDNHLPTVSLACTEGIVDIASCDPYEVFKDVDLVVLACPVPEILAWIKKLPGYIQHPCIVIDLGSTKTDIILALDALPENFDPIGGHPICGKETLSLQSAEKQLYQDAPFVFSPLARTGQRTRNAAVQIAEILNANPIWLDAETHDQILASTSHLPYLLSSALVLATSEDAEQIIGPGFRSSARLAGTPTSMMQGVLASNRENVLFALDRLKVQLTEIEHALCDEDFTGLQSILDLAHSQYQSLIEIS
jgi:prephenate dehydrogenase